MKIHEGKLTARVEGILCTFDGNTWLTIESSAEARDLTDALDDATRSTPKTHTGIRELAELVLRKLNVWENSEIISFEQAPEIPDLPEGAID